MVRPPPAPPPCLSLIILPMSNVLQFLVGVTEAICYDGSLARSGLTPGLHNARTMKTVSSSSPSSSSSVTRSVVAAGTGKGDNNCNDGGAGPSGEMSEGDVTALRESAVLLARKT